MRQLYRRFSTTTSWTGDRYFVGTAYGKSNEAFPGSFEERDAPLECHDPGQAAFSAHAQVDDLGERLVRHPQIHLGPPPEQDHREEAGREREHQGRRHRGDDRPAAAPPPGPFDRRDRPGRDRPTVEEAAQVVGQRLGRGVAPAGLLAQAFQADGLEVARDGAGSSRRGGTGSWLRTWSSVSSTVAAANGGGRSACDRGSRPGRRCRPRRSDVRAIALVTCSGAM